MHLLIVGAGYMAKEYVKVLREMEVGFTVIGRGQERNKVFYNDTGFEAINGGLESNFDELVNFPTHAIITSSLESLEENTLYLINKGVKEILVEKPGALSNVGMKRILDRAQKLNSKIYIAYNRRFYSSVLTAQKLIKEDGGLTSFLFEFTEWSHKAIKLGKTKEQLNNWFIGNSTHVIDLAFFFGGKPKEFNSFVTSTLEWHPKGSIYAGAGVTDRDVFFSYHANWQAPGSWKLELLTTKNRYIFRPLEKLHVQRLGKLTAEEIPIDEHLDIKFKPGLFEQISAFLYNTPLSSNLLTMEEGVDLMTIYERINGENK